MKTRRDVCFTAGFLLNKLKQPGTTTARHRKSGDRVAGQIGAD
jgi:hypothetical protein